jgi:elongation factor G
MEGYAVIRAEVPLKEMFGYSMTVRSLTSGQANFSMEFATYRQVPASERKQLIEKAAS